MVKGRRGMLIGVGFACALACIAPLRLLLPLVTGMLAWSMLTGQRRIERSLVFGSILGLGLFWVAFRALAGWLGPASAATLAAFGPALGASVLFWYRTQLPLAKWSLELRPATSV